MTPDETEHFTLLRAERDRLRAELEGLLESNKALKSKLAAALRAVEKAEVRAEAEHEAAEKMRSVMWQMQIAVDDAIKETGGEKPQDGG